MPFILTFLSTTEPPLGAFTRIEDFTPLVLKTTFNGPDGASGKLKAPAAFVVVLLPPAETAIPLTLPVTLLDSTLPRSLVIPVPAIPPDEVLPPPQPVNHHGSPPVSKLSFSSSRLPLFINSYSV